MVKIKTEKQYKAACARIEELLELWRKAEEVNVLALPDLDMYSARSELNLDAVAVFPVPTLPVRYAVHARPDSASGLNRVSSLDICSSLCTRFFGT